MWPRVGNQLLRKEPSAKKGARVRFQRRNWRGRRRRGEGRLPGKRSRRIFRISYFDFDSYTIRSDDMRILKKVADWLVANRAIKLTIEGYCDERGTIEYRISPWDREKGRGGKRLLCKVGSEPEQDKDGLLREGGAG